MKQRLPKPFDSNDAALLFMEKVHVQNYEYQQQNSLYLYLTYVS